MSSTFSTKKLLFTYVPSRKEDCQSNLRVNELVMSDILVRKVGSQRLVVQSTEN